METKTSWALCFRTNLPIKGNNTNKVVMRVLKDKIFLRSKALMVGFCVRQAPRAKLKISEINKQFQTVSQLSELRPGFKRVSVPQSDLKSSL
jgi:hypothetical protein